MMEMMPELANFLALSTAQAREEVSWWSVPTPLQIAAHLGRDYPPLAYITSARSLVFREQTLLVLRNAERTHILPGGRREEAETLEDTVRREVLEETGWSVQAPHLLGFMHFHYRDAKPEGFPYPHPDFVQVVYVSHAEAYHPGAKLAADYETEACFLSIPQVQMLPLTPSERLYLSVALASRHE
jgi:ADP-ribose pyrophosphatase YjhB (NUDIX family)